MGDQYLSLIISERDFISLCIYWQINDPNIVISYLLNCLIEVVDQDTKEPKIISEIISFCFLIMHNYNINIDKVSDLIINTRTKLKLMLKDATNANLINKSSNIARSLDKIKLLVNSLEYIKDSGSPYYEVNLLWYVIVELKDYNLAKYLINRKSTCLQIEVNGYNILEMFFEYFLSNLDADFDYNRRILYLLVVTKSFNLNVAKIDRLIKIIDSHDISNPKVCEIRSIILDSYDDSELLKTTYCCRYLKPEIESSLSLSDPISNRNDFRKEYTISIDTFNSLGKGRFCIDDAFSLIRKDGHYLLYVHITDIPSFIEINSSEDKRIKSIFAAAGNKYRYRSLFDATLALNYFSLNQSVDRRTITLEVEIDNSGNIVNYRFFNGIICNHHSYYDNEASALFLNGNSLMQDYFTVASLISGKEETNSARVVEIFNKLFGCLACKLFAQNDYPGIFQNYSLISSLVKADNFDNFARRATDQVSLPYLDEFTRAYGIDTLQTHDISPSHGQTYMQFTSPIRKYINIANLRGLREMIIFGNNDPLTIEFYRQYYEEIIARANADSTILKLK